MKITIYQFLALPDEDQYILVFTEGNCIEIKLEGSKRFVLYAVYLFFVEVEYDSGKNKIINKQAFVYGEILDKYVTLDSHVILFSISLSAKMKIQKNLQAQISSLHKPIKTDFFSKDLAEKINNLKLVLKELNVPFQENPFASFKEILDIVKAESPGAFLELSKHGWYLDFSTLPKTPIELNQLVKEGKTAEVDNFLMQYYSAHIDQFQEKLISNHTNRAGIINEAFECFHKELYSSSITLFLTQIDGICYDKARKFYFRNSKKNKRKHIPEIEEALMTETDEFFRAFLSPILNTTAINDHSSKLDQYLSPLNRHTILHGMESNYGSKKNCLKIISLVNYVDDVLCHF